MHKDALLFLWQNRFLHVQNVYKLLIIKEIIDMQITKLIKKIGKKQVFIVNSIERILNISLVANRLVLF